MATVMGIDVNRVVGLTFFLGSALGGAAGVLVGLYYTQIDFVMGYSAGLKAFTAAVLGGIGNIKGAMLGGLLLGVIESLASTFINPAFKDVVAFAVLILTLVFQPRGLLGESSPTGRRYDRASGSNRYGSASRCFAGRGGRAAAGAQRLRGRRARPHLPLFAACARAEHRGRLRRPARHRLRGFLRHRLLCLCVSGLAAFRSAPAVRAGHADRASLGDAPSRGY